MKKTLLGLALAAAIWGTGTPAQLLSWSEGENLAAPVLDNSETEPFEPIEEETEEQIPLEPEQDITPEITEIPEEITPEAAPPLEEALPPEAPFPDEFLEEEPLEENGGYEFEGRLSDGTPNYVWNGEGSPAEDFFSNEAGIEEFSRTDYNYMKNAMCILNRDAEMSDSASSLSDGIHKTENGELRAYKDGRYFKKGRFALEGNVYYADVNGYLLGGWLKVADKDAGIHSMKTSDFVWKYCDLRTRIRFEGGYKSIDGQGHYFIPEESGNLAFNKSYTIDGKYYYCDKYGVCSTLKLKYGDNITDNEGTSLNGYLAVNQLPKDHVVDIQTQVMDGSYSFIPKFNKNSSVEVFGFQPVQLPGGNVYGTLTDDSLKGKIGCWYRNVGTFNGRQIDIKCTITDYTFYSCEGEQEIGYFQVDTEKIGLNATNTKDITANMEFFDHQTGKPVKVKGFATFADIDIRQGVEILSPVEDIFVTKGCKLYKSPSGNLFTAPWKPENTVDADTDFQVQANYHAYSLAYKFYSGCENYCFSDGTAINGESRQVWKSNYTGNVQQYDIVNEKEGCLWQGWQGLYYGRMGRISLSEPLSKTVSDKDEENVLKNTLSDKTEGFTYKLSHYVPYEMEVFRYSSYTIYDDIHTDLKVDPEGCKVLLDDGSDVSSWFQIKVQGQRVSFSVKPEKAAAEEFYNKTYHCYIRVSIGENTDLSQYEGGEYSVKNKGHVMMNRPQGEEKKDSNEVETVLVLPKGQITVTKRIREADITWAHGNPTFFFVVEGKDSAGVLHKYENYIAFSKKHDQVDKDGYAFASIVFENLPLGTYEVYEKKGCKVLSGKSFCRHGEYDYTKGQRTGLRAGTERNGLRKGVSDTGFFSGRHYFLQSKAEI